MHLGTSNISFQLTCSRIRLLFARNTFVLSCSWAFISHSRKRKRLGASEVIIFNVIRCRRYSRYWKSFSTLVHNVCFSSLLKNSLPWPRPSIQLGHLHCTAENTALLYAIQLFKYIAKPSARAQCLPLVLVLGLERKIYSDILPAPSLILRGSKIWIWPRFSSPDAFEVLWFVVSKWCNVSEI